ncbi:MAG: site-specific integrase, partial [Alphaproteobacteria bacterium]|nr:site-specific integrase [Alphaproteobacteria bacterium]
MPRPANPATPAPALPSLVAEFCGWLAAVRRQSPHTVAAYGRDLTAMFAFWKNHLQAEAVTLDELRGLQPEDVQAYLAH